MKTIRWVSCLLTGLTLALSTGADAAAQDAEKAPTGETTVIYDPKRFEAGEEFRWLARGETNPITLICRKVTWPGNSVGRLVFFWPETREAVCAAPNEQVFAWRSKLYCVINAGNQGFRLAPSTRIGTNTLTPEAAIQIALVTFPPATKWVDLRWLLWDETLAVGLAQGLPLREIQVTPEKDRLVGRFVSYSGLRGTVVLDEKLDVVSQTLDEASVKEWEQRWKRKQP